MTTAAPAKPLIGFTLPEEAPGLVRAASLALGVARHCKADTWAEFAQKVIDRDDDTLVLLAGLHIEPEDSALIAEYDQILRLLKVRPLITVAVCPVCEGWVLTSGAPPTKCKVTRDCTGAGTQKPIKASAATKAKVPIPAPDPIPVVEPVVEEPVVPSQSETSENPAAEPTQEAAVATAAEALEFEIIDEVVEIVGEVTPDAEAPTAEAEEETLVFEIEDLDVDAPVAAVTEADDNGDPVANEDDLVDFDFDEEPAAPTAAAQVASPVVAAAEQAVTRPATKTAQVDDSTDEFDAFSDERPDPWAGVDSEPEIDVSSMPDF